MKKIYRISVFNNTTKRRELLWNEFTSKKKAQEIADTLNRTSNAIDAKVITK